jgi:2-C-methyl-D-erythritol 4-phosphate cytidylyltransferase
VSVRTCPGRDENWKITLPADLQRAEAVLRARESLS